ncbi:hypothetical protein CRH09_16105 [Nocardia terpenica]|uniref:Uncharacterized protein n=1 Tax=Nocardia terpenica TaxID=455432 RepID=A0A291RJE9_9NOCA|nr:hypothetical protein CRH09_16105 [Nocardia terpenica]
MVRERGAGGPSGLGTEAGIPGGGLVGALGLIGVRNGPTTFAAPGGFGRVVEDFLVIPAGLWPESTLLQENSATSVPE